MSISKHRLQSNHHQVTQQKLPESSWAKLFKILISFGNIVKGELRIPSLH